MADKKTDAKDIDWMKAKAWQSAQRYYYELARMTTGLFIGVMALMTFLLTVGLQHPQKPFEPVFYTTVSVLAASLIFFVIGNMAQQMLMKQKMSEAAEGKIKQAKMMLKTVRILQQLLFVASVVAVLVFVMVSGHIFFAIPATPAGGAAPVQ